MASVVLPSSGLEGKQADVGRFVTARETSGHC
ncbi:hypothetical protein cypCar_00001664, partial [Cyprinus carpio]